MYFPACSLCVFNCHQVQSVYQSQIYLRAAPSATASSSVFSLDIFISLYSSPLSPPPSPSLSVPLSGMQPEGRRGGGERERGSRWAEEREREAGEALAVITTPALSISVSHDGGSFPLRLHNPGPFRLRSQPRAVRPASHQATLQIHRGRVRPPKGEVFWVF